MIYLYEERKKAMKSYHILLNALEEGIEELKVWQERLLEQNSASMELEGLILHLIEAEEESEIAYLAEEKRKNMQIHQKRIKNSYNFRLDKGEGKWYNNKAVARRERKVKVARDVEGKTWGKKWSGSFTPRVGGLHSLFTWQSEADVI